LFLLLAAVALTAAGCSLTGHPTTTPTTRVLGEPKATPLAVGQPAPGGTGQLGAVSCADATRCWAVGVAGPNTAPAGGATVIVATKNGGTTWKAQHLTGGATPQLSGISCPTRLACMAVGTNGASVPGSGVVVTTEDGGVTWSPASAPASALTVAAVTCSDTSDCTALVSQGTVMWSAHSADFGQTWQPEGNLPSLFVASDDLVCSTGGACLVPGYVPTANSHGAGAVALSTNGGQTWALATLPAGIGVLQSIACPTPSDCLAAGTTATTVSDVVPAKGELLYSIDGGQTWALGQGPSAVDDVYGLACPSADQCTMVGTKWIGFPAIALGAVAQSVNGGTTFKNSPLSYVPITLTAVTCPSASACVAVGGDTLARITLLQPMRTAHTTSAGSTSGGSSTH
jgi:BNR/Asp-box repeat